MTIDEKLARVKELRELRAKIDAELATLSQSLSQELREASSEVAAVTPQPQPRQFGWMG